MKISTVPSMGACAKERKRIMCVKCTVKGAIKGKASS